MSDTTNLTLRLCVLAFVSVLVQITAVAQVRILGVNADLSPLVVAAAGFLTGALPGALFGFGIGNATSLPPLIAQVEFAKDDVARVVPMIVAIGQGTYAFAPAVFGLIREFAPQVSATAPAAAPYLFLTATAIQLASICCFLLGRWRS